MSTISIKNLSFAYNGQDLLFDNVSLSLNSQWKLGLLGRNGRGKTTLLNIIQGKLDYSGKISANIDFEYFPQAISDKDNLTLYAIQDKFHVEQWELEKEFSQLQLDPKVLWQPFNTLSGGEPLNYLDTFNQDQIIELIKTYRPTMLIIEHDSCFIDEIDAEVVELQKP